jgi:hypothetical protein
VTVAQERQVGGEQEQPGLGDECEAGAQRRHRSGTEGPLSRELDMWIAGERYGQFWLGRPDDDEMTGSRARRRCRNRIEQRPAANLDCWLVCAPQPAGPAASEDERGQQRACGRQVSRRLRTSAEPAGGSQDR